jgi:hypothetical protein
MRALGISQLGDDLLSLEDMGETRHDTVEPSPDKLLAAEEAAVERYLDDERRMK